MPNQPNLRVIKGSNPLAEQIRAKVSALEAYQSPRTAREFFDTMVSIFESQKITFSNFFFSDQWNTLIFRENESEMFEMVSWGKKVLRGFAYHNADKRKEIAVMALPASRILGLKEDILLGRNHPNDYMPIRVNTRVNLYQRGYPITYQGQRTFFPEPKIS